MQNLHFRLHLEETAVLQYTKANSRAMHIGKSERKAKSITVNLDTKRKNDKRNGFWKIKSGM